MLKRQAPKTYDCAAFIIAKELRGFKPQAANGG